MLIKKYETLDEWLADRKNRVGGSGLGDIYSPKIASKKELTAALEKHKIEFKKSGTIAELEDLLPDTAKAELFQSAPKKMAVYQLIADRMAMPPEAYQDPRDYGHENEAAAIAALSEKTDIEFNTDLVMWISEEDEHMAFSPDGYTTDEVKAAEAKCLEAKKHIKVLIENRIPDDYYEQSIQPFIVNPKLEELYFAFYNKYVTARPLHVITVKREDVATDIQMLKDYQIAIMDWVDNWVERLVF